MFFANGMIFEGTYENGLENGPGKMTLLSVSVIEGTWVKGKLNGEARISFADGHHIESIKGHFVDGSLFKGIINYSKGSIFKRYEGFLKGKTPHGIGEMVFADHSFYRGAFVNGVQHGFGREDKSTGEFYEGEWVNGKAHGRGKQLSLDGRRLEGLFKNGTLIEGTIFYPERSFYKIYRGSLKKGLPDGFGVRMYSTGKIYKGMFRKGIPNGLGKLLSTDGSVLFEGEFVNGTYSRSRPRTQEPADSSPLLTSFPDSSSF